MELNNLYSDGGKEEEGLREYIFICTSYIKNARSLRECGENASLRYFSICLTTTIHVKLMHSVSYNDQNCGNFYSMHV